MHMPDVQPLIGFIDFLKEEFDLEGQELKSADKIRKILSELTPDSEQDCSMSLDLYDRDIQSQQSDRKGVYWREWSMFLEAGLLEVRARSNSEPEKLNHGHFSMEWYYDFAKGQEEGSGSLQQWLDDAKSYRQYMTEYLDDIEVDFDV